MGIFKKQGRNEDEPAPGVAWRGAESLRPLLVPIESLSADSENARKHPERNLEVIRESLKMYGQNKPAVARNGVVIAGNGLLAGALSLGWPQIAVVDASHLTAEQALAYGLVDNKAGELSEWDFEKVADILKSLPEDMLDFTGFADFEREPLMQAQWEPPTATPGETSSSSGGGEGPVSFLTTAEQASTIRRAIEKVKTSEQQADIPDGRALELICADFLAGS